MNDVTLKVWGEYACFTRPEMKAERVSYDVMTPSAARGVLEAIHFKPAIRWIIDEIQVINPIKFTTIRRNEVSDKINAKTLKSNVDKNVPVFLDVAACRQQRAATILKDVCYVIKAHFEMTEQAGERDNMQKHFEMFKRRASKGQCFYQPYLGCKEFVAHFEWVEDEVIEPLAETKDLSFMLYDINFKDHMNPVFFRATMENGVIKMPEDLKREVNV